MNTILSGLVIIAIGILVAYIICRVCELFGE
jgi:hypothetical protein